MADMNAEEAFLKSMKDMADAEAVQYEAGDANGTQTDSISSDEYDPAQAVPENFSHIAQDPILPPGAVKQSPILQSLDQSSTLTSNVAATDPQDQAVDEDDGRSQSQSMSGSSSSSSSLINIHTSNVPFQVDTPTEPVVEESASLQTPHVITGAGQVSTSSAIRSPASVLSGAAKNVPPQTHVSIESSSRTVSNGIVDTLSETTAPLPESGSAAQTEMTAEAAPEHTIPQDLGVKDSNASENEIAQATQIPRARLPQDRIGILEDRIQEDPRGDMEAWLSLIDEYRKRGKLDEARTTYDRFFVVFPAAVRIGLILSFRLC